VELHHSSSYALGGEYVTNELGQAGEDADVLVVDAAPAHLELN
jgi:hypothetical protein